MSYSHFLITLMFGKILFIIKAKLCDNSITFRYFTEFHVMYCEITISVASAMYQMLGVQLAWYEVMIYLVSIKAKCPPQRVLKNMRQSLHILLILLTLLFKKSFVNQECGIFKFIISIYC